MDMSYTDPSFVPNYSLYGISEALLEVSTLFKKTKAAFFCDYSGIGIIGMDGICVRLGTLPFSE